MPRALRRRALTVSLALLAASSVVFGVVPAQALSAVAVTTIASKNVATASTPTPRPTTTSSPSPTPSPTPSPKPFTAVGEPTLSGTATVGRTLRVAPGTWKPTPSGFTYQWLRSGKAISGATASTYTLTAADADATVSAKVTATRDGYVTASATTEGKKVGRAFTAAPVPTISGTVAVGKKLTASHAAWAPAPVALSYRWYRGSSAISGADGKTYTLVAADAGKKVSVRVTGTKSGYTTVTTASDAVSVPKVLTVPSTVSFSGTPTVGSVLTAKPGTWGPSPVTFRYEWLRGGKTISGATKKTYTLVSADAGHEISVRITGSKSGYTTVTRTSGTVDAKWGFTSSPSPKVTGTVAAGRQLRADVGTWKPAPTLSYQWRVDGSDVAGATSSTWTVPEWAAGRLVTVEVTAKKSGYLTVTRQSAKRSASWSLGDVLRPGTAMRTGTYLASPNGTYRLTVQGDGNVVLTKNGTPLRSTKTTGTIDPVLVLREDGLLAVYSSSDRPAWQSGTTGYAVSALTLDNSGNLRLVEVDGLWTWDQKKLPAYSDATAATGSTPGRYGWAYPIRPSATMTTYSGHSGDDFPEPTGTPVYAMRGGKAKVEEVWITSGCPSWAPNNTRQKQVRITSVIDGTEFELNYAHLSKFSVKNGQTVKAGQKIGEVGSTGCSTGPHLHLGVKVDGVAKILYPRDLLGTASY